LVDGLDPKGKATKSPEQKEEIESPCLRAVNVMGNTSKNSCKKLGRAAKEI
jgi:hypothetical protein